MSNIIELSCINLAEGSELTTPRDCLRSSKRIRLAACHMVAPVNGSYLNEDSRVLRIRGQTAKKSLLRRILSECLGYKRMFRQLTLGMVLPAEGAWGTKSQGILCQLLRIQIRTKNNAAAKCEQFAISLTMTFLRRVLACNGGR